MLGAASHADKVNFCKFTNETRNAIEDASQNSGQTSLQPLRELVQVVATSCACDRTYNFS